MAKNNAGDTVDLEPRDLFSIPAKVPINNTTTETVPNATIPIGAEGNEPGVNPNDPPNKQNQDRYEYWQSQATQTQKMLEKYQSFAPVVEYLEKNPSVIGALEAHLNSQLNPQPVTQVTPEVALIAPVKPVKPKNYDPVDYEPDSVSAKYRDDLEAYHEAKDEYRDALLVKELSPYKLAIARDAQQREEYVKDQGVKAQLITTRKWNEEKANGFIQFAKDPRNLQALPEYYEFLIAKEAATNGNAPVAKPVVPVKSNGSNPAPVPPLGPGLGAKTIDTKRDDGFDRSKDLFARSKK